MRLLAIVLLLLVVVGVPAHSTEIIVMGRNSLMSEVTDHFNERMAEQGKDLMATFILGDHQKFQVTLAAGTAPDVMSLDLIQAPGFNLQGAFRSLAAQYDKLPWKDGLSPGMLQLGLWEGEVYLLPFFSDNSALFWNKNRLREAGLVAEGPRTWDDFLAALKKTTDPDRDLYGVEQLPKWGGGGYMFLFMPWVWSNGGNLLSEDGKSAAINSEEALQAVSLWRDIVRVHGVSRPQGNQFNSGKDAFQLSGNWNVASLVNDVPDLDWGVSLFPTRLASQTPSSFVGGDLIGITAQSNHPVEAWEFIQFALSSEVQVDIFARQGVIPIRREFGDNPYFRREPRYNVFAEAMVLGRAPYTVVYDQLYVPLTENLDPVFRGEQPPEQALEQLARDIDVVLQSAGM